MNKSCIISLALAIALSQSAGVLSAEPSSATALVKPPEIEPAVLTDVPAPLHVANSPLLVKLILDGRTAIQDRLEAVQELGNNLSRSEIDSFYCFLKSHPDSQEKNIAGLRALKNNLINALKDQNSPPAGLTASLIDMFHDRAQDFVIRDYAVQHLTSWYSRSSADSSDAKQRIKNALEEALRENSSIAGTALLGLHRLSSADGSFDGAEIDQTALQMTKASDTSLATRITVIQICAERGLAQALPEIEHFAKARGQTALQISAIAALGQLGNAEDATLLERLESEDDVALRPAITAALKKLPRRLASREHF
jgi:hypothetical protein